MTTALLEAEILVARLTRLQRITAALSNTLTQDGVAESVLREAIVALECDAGAVVICGDAGAGDAALHLLREAGWLDPLLSSFHGVRKAGLKNPYADVLAGEHLYLESFDEMAKRYPAFARVKNAMRNAWILLPLQIENRIVGALAFGFGETRSFTEHDRQFGDTVARYCAQALDRVRLRIAAAAALEEAQEARLQAEQANNHKTVFLRAISHELRTPLTAIAGYTDILSLGIHGALTPEQTTDVDRIRRASGYLLRLIKDVLMVSRVEGQQLRMGKVPVNRMLLEVGEQSALQAKAGGVDLVVVPFDETVLVAADADRLQQILLNLLTNAIKFTENHGTVTLQCAVVDGMVNFRISDTGVGIRPGDLDRIFEAFVQIDRYRMIAEKQGSGLGLSISRDLARAMHGDISVASMEGVGSTFTLVLPLAAEPPALPGTVSA